MEIFEILHVQNPEDGNVVQVFLTKEETQVLLKVAFHQLAALGAVSLTTEKNGVNVEDLEMGAQNDMVN